MWVVRIVNIYSLSNFQVCNIVLLTIVNMPHTAAAAAKSLQSCPNLCDPIDSSPPGSPILGKNAGVGLPFPSPMHESEKSK